jgi:DNA processing protein
MHPPLPDRDSLRALLAMRAIPGLGDIRLRRWLEPAATPVDALAALLRARPDAAAFLGQPAVRARIDRALRTIETTPDAFTLHIGAAGYPRRLLDLHDPPAVLFGRGDASLAGGPAVAIVGTRANTEYGADVARMIATAAAGAGIVVISGLAHGVDRHAHEAVLDAGGRTIGVIGSGLDVTYPPQHRRLQERIAGEGLVLTEFAPGEPALGHHFPRRNRIIAALASAVVVVEAPVRSGALITAEHALELGREVLAVPGPIGRRTSEGANALIRDGAAIVLDAADVLEATLAFERTAGRTPACSTGSPAAAGPRAGVADAHQAAVVVNPGQASDRTAPPGVAAPGGVPAPAPIRLASPAAAALMRALGNEPAHADVLVERSGLDAAEALACLLDLELSGSVRQHPGSRFSLSPAARARP